MTTSLSVTVALPPASYRLSTQLHLLAPSTASLSTLPPALPPLDGINGVLSALVSLQGCRSVACRGLGALAPQYGRLRAEQFNVAGSFNAEKKADSSTGRLSTPPQCGLRVHRHFLRVQLLINSAFLYAAPMQSAAALSS